MSDSRSRGREFPPDSVPYFRGDSEIDHEIIFMVIFLQSADSSRVVVSYRGKYVHRVLDNCLVKLAQEISVVR